MICIKMTGKVQGVFPGDATTKGYEKQIAAAHIQFGYARPFDAHSGLASGGIVARPVVIRKTADASSTFLMQACFTNEVVTKVIVTFLVSSSGTLSGITSKAILTLNNAIVQIFEHQCEESGGVGTETITLTYQSMSYDWIDGKTTAANDWTGVTGV